MTFFQFFVGFSFLAAFFSQFNSQLKKQIGKILLFGCFLFQIKKKAVLHTRAGAKGAGAKHSK